MPLVTAFLAGVLFGSGQILAGMTNRAKALAFLDLAGRWYAGRWYTSLAFGMVGAIPVAAIGFHLAGRPGRSLFGGKLHVPGAMRAGE